MLCNQWMKLHLNNEMKLTMLSAFLTSYSSCQLWQFLYRMNSILERDITLLSHRTFENSQLAVVTSSELNPNNVLYVSICYALYLWDSKCQFCFSFPPVIRTSIYFFGRTTLLSSKLTHIFFLIFPLFFISGQDSFHFWMECPDWGIWGFVGMLQNVIDW